MNVYDAIMAAAAHIEAVPTSFNFMNSDLPEKRCGSPSCAVGWVGFFRGIHGGTCWTAAPEALGVSYFDFVWALDECVMELGLVASWRHDAKTCAAAMRHYAKKRFGEPRAMARPTSALVADLMTKIMGERIPEDA